MHSRLGRGTFVSLQLNQNETNSIMFLPDIKVIVHDFLTLRANKTWRFKNQKPFFNKQAALII